jgi:hypothetical protein
VGCWKAIRAVVRCVASAIVQRDVIDIKVGTIANAEAMNWVVLDVDVMNRAVSKHFRELDEVVRSVVLVRNIECTNTILSDSLSDTSIASYTIPPSLTIAIKNGAFGSCNFEIGTADLDEGIVSIKVLPEGRTLECDFASVLQL